MKRSERKKIIRAAVSKGTRPLVKQIKAKAPRQQRQRATGGQVRQKRLASSLDFKIVTLGGETIVSVVGQNTRKAQSSKGSNAGRAVNIHLTIQRTKPHEIEAKSARALTWRAPGIRGRRRQLLAFARVNHPGTPPNNWLERAARAGLPEAERLIISDAAKRAEDSLRG